MSHSVLIVEDEKQLQDVYKLILTLSGHTVLTANNGIEGLRSIEKHRPDCVLLDIFMPKLNGKEVLKKLDKSRHPKMKIVVYSNLSDLETEQEVLSSGADKFVLKSSMTPQQLVQMVNEVMSR
jgi:two-component system nitrogen regulation response regulator NtrX